MDIEVIVVLIMVALFIGILIWMVCRDNVIPNNDKIIDEIFKNGNHNFQEITYKKQTTVPTKKKRNNKKINKKTNNRKVNLTSSTVDPRKNKEKYF